MAVLATAAAVSALVWATHSTQARRPANVPFDTAAGVASHRADEPVIITRDELEARRSRLGDAAATKDLLDLLAPVARKNPGLALECALSWTRPGDQQIGLVSALLKPWADADQTAAWAWVRQHFGTANGDGSGVPAATPLLQVLAAHDPRMAVSYADAARALGAGATQACYAAVIALVTTGHAQNARTAVEYWLSNPRQGGINHASVTLVALALSQQESPAMAGGWLLNLPNGIAAYGDAAGMLASTWAERDPLSALKWAEALPVAAVRTVATERAFAVLADHDADGAADWFLSHESQAGSDRLIPIFLQQSQLSRTSPEAAADWAGLTNDPSARARAQAIIAGDAAP